ncbi:MAG TPA: hypothetical protein VH816_03065 [Gaiellaceae bacterium]|jgi:hypothetical protein
MRTSTAAIAAAAALVFSGLAAGTAGAGPRQAEASTAKVVALHEAMDRLWTDHVTWTRLVIVDFAAGAPNLKPDLARLLRNQADIGNAIKPFYGAAAGTQLTRLLHTHIMEAVPVLSAAKAGQQAKLATALKAWYANAHQIAAFLAKANAKSWPLPAMTKMMNTHLRLTTNEAAAQLKGQWQASIGAYDEVRAEILMMADMLADGIVQQFPARFA